MVLGRCGAHLFAFFVCKGTAFALRRARKEKNPNGFLGEAGAKPGTSETPMQEELRAGVSLNGSKVFRLKDVFFPEYEELIGRATSDLRLRGRIIDFSDSGNKKNEFAIVEVEGIKGPIVVPVEKLRAVWEDEAGASNEAENES